MNTDSEAYRFASADEIKSLGVKYKTNYLNDDIANHTYKVLNENSDKLEKKKAYNYEVNIPLMSNIDN